MNLWIFLSAQNVSKIEFTILFLIALFLFIKIVLIKYLEKKWGISNAKNIIRLTNVVIIITLYLTNPTVEKHQQEVSDKIRDTFSAFPESKFPTEMKNSEQINSSLSNNYTLQNIVDRNNYLLISFTKITFNNNSKIIGIGILGNVWIFEDNIRL